VAIPPPGDPARGPHDDRLDAGVEPGTSRRRSGCRSSLAPLSVQADAAAPPPRTRPRSAGSGGDGPHRLRPASMPSFQPLTPSTKWCGRWRTRHSRVRPRPCAPSAPPGPDPAPLPSTRAPPGPALPANEAGEQPTALGVSMPSIFQHPARSPPPDLAHGLQHQAGPQPGVVVGTPAPTWANWRGRGGTSSSNRNRCPWAAAIRRAVAPARLQPFHGRVVVGFSAPAPCRSGAEGLEVRPEVLPVLEVEGPSPDFSTAWPGRRRGGRLAATAAPNSSSISTPASPREPPGEAAWKPSTPGVWRRPARELRRVGLAAPDTEHVLLQAAPVVEGEDEEPLVVAGCHASPGRVGDYGRGL